MAKQRKKRKRKSGATAASSSGSAKTGASGAKPAARSGGGGAKSGGVMQSIRSGFRQVAGAETPKEKPSRLSNIIWTVILLAAVALLLYRWYG